jgi:pectin methylesterase-like acyl-CoA thioesterase
MNNYLIKSLLILFSACITITSLARVIYVDQSTAVSGDGSFTSPFKAIQEAADLAVSGDTVMLRAGNYREQVIIKSDGVTFMAYNQEKAIINGTEALLNWENVSGPVYKTRMNWNVTEGGQSNQVFLDGNMMYLSRSKDGMARAGPVRCCRLSRDGSLYQAR